MSELQVYGELPPLERATRNAERQVGKRAEIQLVPGFTVEQAWATYGTKRPRFYGKRCFGLYADGDWKGTIRLDSHGNAHFNAWAGEDGFIPAERGQEKLERYLAAKAARAER